MLAAVAADSIWYQLGRRKGIRVLQLLCKISLEPDSCVRRTEGVFAKRRCTFAALRQISSRLEHRRTSSRRHLSHARAAVFFSSMPWVHDLVGRHVSRPRFRVQRPDRTHRRIRSPHLGGGLLVLVLAAFAAYIAYKFIARQRFLRELRIARITVEELKEKIDAGEELVIVDLRHSMDFEAEPEIIPGAFRMDAKELEEKNDRLPRDREVILYCT